MLPRAWRPCRLGRSARALLLVSGLILTGCAGTPKSGEMVVRPSFQRQATHQVVGEAIVSSLGGVAVTVHWLGATGVEQFYAARPGLVYPWPREVWQGAPPTVFFLRLRNQTSEEVQFDPMLATIVTQDGRRERPYPYEEMYLQLEGTEGSGPRLRTLQATLFSRFVVVAPSGEREGLLVFPALEPEAVHLVLELSSFFVGGRNLPGFFEFQVLRK